MQMTSNMDKSMSNRWSGSFIQGSCQQSIRVRIQPINSQFLGRAIRLRYGQLSYYCNLVDNQLYNKHCVCYKLYKCLWGVGDKGRSSSLLKKVSHTYILRLSQSRIFIFLEFDVDIILCLAYVYLVGSFEFDIILAKWHLNKSHL